VCKFGVWIIFVFFIVNTFSFEKKPYYLCSQKNTLKISSSNLSEFYNRGIGLTLPKSTGLASFNTFKSMTSRCDVFPDMKQYSTHVLLLPLLPKKKIPKYGLIKPHNLITSLQEIWGFEEQVEIH
jgi:hypothetical protein